MSCDCTLCKRRTGAQVPEVAIEYPPPKECTTEDPCSHCKAQRETGLITVYCGFVDWNDSEPGKPNDSVELTGVRWDATECAKQVIKWIRKDLLEQAGGEEAVIERLLKYEIVRLPAGMSVHIDRRMVQ